VEVGGGSTYSQKPLSPPLNTTTFQRKILSFPVYVKLHGPSHPISSHHQGTTVQIHTLPLVPLYLRTDLCLAWRSRSVVDFGYIWGCANEIGRTSNQPLNANQSLSKSRTGTGNPNFRSSYQSSSLLALSQRVCSTPSTPSQSRIPILPHEILHDGRSPFVRFKPATGARRTEIGRGNTVQVAIPIPAKTHIVTTRIHVWRT
jgi:hypothetical protein